MALVYRSHGILEDPTPSTSKSGISSNEVKFSSCADYFPWMLRGCSCRKIRIKYEENRFDLISLQPSYTWFLYGWLSKLWSLFGYPKYQVPYYNRDPKRDHNFDNHPNIHTPLSLQRRHAQDLPLKAKGWVFLIPTTWKHEIHSKTF